jgi:hypothetical protein
MLIDNNLMGAEYFVSFPGLTACGRDKYNNGKYYEYVKGFHWYQSIGV